jgi:tetratricopeptide (TPR) repeat protein
VGGKRRGRRVSPSLQCSNTPIWGEALKFMKKLSLTLIFCIVGTGWAWAHGDISSLPDSGQIMQYRLLLYMSPDDPAPRNKLAMVLYRTNQLKEAKSELDHVLQRDPLNFDALDGLGLVLTKMERYQEALECLNKAVRINEQDVMVHVHLSVVYQKMNLPEKAQSELEKARSLVSDRVQLEDIEKELKLVGGM